MPGADPRLRPARAPAFSSNASSPREISTCQLMPGYPIPVGTMHRHQPALLTEFDRNENRANMAVGTQPLDTCV
jgi:hypothetical protein